LLFAGRSTQYFNCGLECFPLQLAGRWAETCIAAGRLSPGAMP
jgi:hypothetical protein